MLIQLKKAPKELLDYLRVKRFGRIDVGLGRVAYLKIDGGKYNDYVSLGHGPKRQPNENGTPPTRGGRRASLFSGLVEYSSENNFFSFDVW